VPVRARSFHNGQVTNDQLPHTPGLTFLDDLMRSLGQVTHLSAVMDYTLRSAFCSLVGSKYAAVVAGGQGTDWLIRNCRAVAKVHRELTDAGRDAILEALDACEKANSQRNVLVHGIKTGVRADDGRMHTIRSRYGRHVPDVQAWSPDQVTLAVIALGQADQALFHAMQTAVSSEMSVIGDLLAWEEAQQRQALAPDADH
jgi:hypothetical protein